MSEFTPDSTRHELQRLVDLFRDNIAAGYNRLVDLVSRMSTPQLARQVPLSDSDRKLHDQRAMILDREIDALVYELSGLTEEEIGIVEGYVS